jgi:hypothetical protein
MQLLGATQPRVSPDHVDGGARVAVTCPEPAQAGMGGQRRGEYLMTGSSSVGDWLQRRQAPIAFALGLLFLWAVQYRACISGFHWDSSLYWDLANPADFQADTKTFRGYVFPFCLYLIRQLTEMAANPVSAYGAVACVIYAALLTEVVPKWFAAMFGGELSLGRRLVPVVLLGILFPGLILYPLSDLPAMLLSWGGLFSVYRAAVARKFGGRSCMYWLVLAGVLAGAAYNVRPIYIFMVPTIALLIVLMFARMRVTAIGAALLGLVMVSLPQAMFNLKGNDEFTPLVTLPMPGKNSLFVLHLMSGMTIQRYETTFDGGVSYPDPAGKRLVKKLKQHEQLATHEEYWAGTAPKTSVSDYVRMVARYPLDFLGIYARHVVNGLDVRDGRAYLSKPSVESNGRSVFNFLVLALATWTLLVRRVTNPDTASEPRVPRLWWVGLLAILLPMAAIIPGVVETRYFLPLHLLAYCVIAFYLRPKEVWTYLKSHPTWLLVTAMVGGLYFSIVLSAMAQI